MSAEAIGAQVLKVMMFLTPNRIGQMTDHQIQAEKVSLTDMMLGTDLGDGKYHLGKAKIIPIGEHLEEESSEEINEPSQQQVKKVEELRKEPHKNKEQPLARDKTPHRGGNKNLNVLGIRSAQEEKQIKEDQEAEIRSQLPSASDFLLSEKEKTQDSQSKLKKVEILDLYKKVIKSQPNKGVDDNKPLENKGILLNKIQD